MEREQAIPFVKNCMRPRDADDLAGIQNVLGNSSEEYAEYIRFLDRMVREGDSVGLPPRALLNFMHDHPRISDKMRDLSVRVGAAAQWVKEMGLNPEEVQTNLESCYPG